MSLGHALKPEFSTDRLRLRPLDASDAGLLTLYCSDSRLAMNTMRVPHPYPPGMAEGWISRVTSPDSDMVVWALDRSEDTKNALVGVIGLRDLEAGEADVSYWVAPAFWGGGLATAAVGTIAAEARAAGGRTLTASVMQDNEASIRVLTRNGFEYTGDSQAHSVARGGMVPVFCYRCDLTRD